MFCPKCGQPEQQIGAFCRKCGILQPDPDNPQSRPVSPRDHFNASATLNLMTGIVSLGLAITLYVMFLGKSDTPIVIYVTAGFLTAMFFWQAQAFWRTMLLKKQFPGLNRYDKKQPAEETSVLGSRPTSKLLNEPNLSNAVPPSVTERTTNKLDEKVPRKSS